MVKQMKAGTSIYATAPEAMRELVCTSKAQSISHPSPVQFRILQQLKCTRLPLKVENNFFSEFGEFAEDSFRTASSQHP